VKNRLKELRQQYKWSQAELARELGVSRQAVNGFESGKFDPSLDMAFKIASLFSVEIEDIFIYEARQNMQTLIERVKNFFGFEFGFERFSEEAINVFNFARNEAVRSHSLRVTPEHLLAGLLADSNSTSAQLLRASGANLDIETNEDSFMFRENLEFSPQSKFVLELALQVVRLQGKKAIEPEHLLWGLIQLVTIDKAVLDETFQRYEVDVESLSHQLREVI